MSAARNSGQALEILFLGYDRAQTGLIEHLEARHSVQHTAARVEDLSAFDAVVSFGYRHILPNEVRKTARRPAINLHISYLPFNRGAHPNFWSWIENTQAGVTIHEIDDGIDTGPIIAQQKLRHAGTGMTFRQTHALLLSQIEMLFAHQSERILAGDYVAVAQTGCGTYHAARDLPAWVDWDMPIKDAVARFRSTAVRALGADGSEA